MDANTPLTDRFSAIRAFAFDMDGVLTDGGLWLSESGEWIRRMHIRDGYALQLAVRMGYAVAVVSGSASKPVAGRLKKLGVTDIHMGVDDKAACLGMLMSAWGLPHEAVLFMGDDVPDLPALTAAGLGCCPSDACRDVRETAAYVSSFRGGEGCVRDVIERVMRCRGDWHAMGDIRSA
jgi:3-deoxy-D-manno-octulosonate 8-phosphate phosphatase (KDO 8-P phosphatase)